MPRWAIISAPADKRTVGFRDALKRCGQDPALELTWREVSDNPRQALGSLRRHDFLRIDSPGADAAALASLAHRGSGTLAEDFSDGRWQPGRQRHAGLTAILHQIQHFVDDVGLRVLADTRDIAIMGDKALCREHLKTAGIRIPDGLPECSSYDDLLASMMEKRWQHVFIKPRWGSSGAGIIAFRRSSNRGDAHQLAITTLSATTVDGDVRFFNSKRARTVTDPMLIRTMINLVLTDGAVVERWIPKITCSGGPADLRIIAIAGRLRHRIVRVGSGPITNLHLDAHRYDADVFLAQADDVRRAQILATAQRVAEAFPRSHYLGMDLLITHSFRDCLVAEVNAWGDLLPRLEHDGEDTFTAEVRALLAEKARTPPCSV